MLERILILIMISLTRQQFEKIVDDAVAEVPKKFLEKLDNVVIVVRDFPSRKQLGSLEIKTSVTGKHAILSDPSKSSTRPYLLLGLYHGVPQTKRWGGGAIFPDRITIFKNPIEYLSNSKEEVQRIVRDTVKHEIAHHFGMSENEIRRTSKR